MFGKNKGTEIKERKEEQVMDNKKIIKISLNKLIILLIFVIVIAIGTTILIINTKNKDEKFFIEDNNIIALDKTEDITTEADFISEIKAKYPTESESICTDGDNYWLSSADGEKVYFTNIESFEMAMEACFNIAHEDELREEFGKMVDKKTFLNNLTDENKNELATFIKTKPIKKDKIKDSNPFKLDDENNRVYIYPINDATEYIEDRFIIKDNEILYCLIYKTGSTTFAYKIYVITPAKMLPEKISSINDLTEYFVINVYTSHSVPVKKAKATDEDIENAKKELNEEIEEAINNLDERKENLFRDTDRKLKIMRFYFDLCPKLPENYRDYVSSNILCDLYPQNKIKNSSFLWTKGECYNFDKSYIQAVNNNKVLYVIALANELKPESQMEEYYTEYFSVGIYIDFNDFPFIVDEFSIGQLLLTGYLPEFSDKNCVITSKTKKVGQCIDISEKEVSKLIIEQNNYIRSYFGL